MGVLEADRILSILTSAHRGYADFCAGVAAVGQQTIRAAQLFGASEALIKEIATPLYQPDLIEYDRNIGGVRAGIDDLAIADAWHEGQALSLDEAVALALDANDA